MQICEIFNSIQGEGIHAGRRASFIRTWGCSMGCEFCDTKFANEALEEKEQAIDEIVADVHEIREKTGINLIIITGGEPTEQIKDLNDLVYQLKLRSFEIHLETNGTGKAIKYSEFNHVCMSPKDNVTQIDAILKCGSVELKFLYNRNDPDNSVLLAKGFKDVITQNALSITVQPLDHGGDLLQQYHDLLLLDPFAEFATVRYLPQLHKLANAH